jgi:hypothetical protein
LDDSLYSPGVGKQELTYIMDRIPNGCKCFGEKFPLTFLNLKLCITFELAIPPVEIYPERVLLHLCIKKAIHYSIIDGNKRLK